MRIFAADADGNTISLIYFNNPGWAKRQLPMGETRIVSGKLEAYGDEWQIIHPEVAEPGKGPPPAIREPVYPLTEGLTNRRLGELAARRSSARPSLPNGSSRASLSREALARLARVACAEAHREPGSGARASGSPMTRFSPTSSRCCCCASRGGGTHDRRCPAPAS